MKIKKNERAQFNGVLITTQAFNYYTERDFLAESLQKENQILKLQENRREGTFAKEIIAFIGGVVITSVVVIFVGK